MKLKFNNTLYIFGATKKLSLQHQPNSCDKIEKTKVVQIITLCKKIRTAANTWVFNGIRKQPLIEK
jgi:hypothetical protein